MADLIPPMLIQLQADVTQLKAGLAQAENALKGVDDSVKTASTGMTNFMGKIKQVGATMGVAFAATQVVQFGKDIIMAASDMNESLGKMNVVFGDNAKAVEEWANKSDTAMGMSKQSAIEAAGTYGNLFQAFGLGQEPAQKMSTSLVQLASDMASFNNTSIDDAILALRSGLSGETEPLKKFGVALSDARLKEQALAMGLIKSTKEAWTPAAKAQASYALIMQDTKLAQGDFARTADGTANTMRILSAQMQNAKAALGGALLPVFQATLLIMKPLIAGIKMFGDFLQKHADDVKVFTIAILAFAAAWGVYTIAANAAKIATAALNAVLAINPLVAIAIAIGLVAVGLYELYKRSETFKKAVTTMAKVAILAFAAIIPMIGQVFEAIMKIQTGPLRLLLMALSHLPGVGKYAKAGLDLMNKGLNGISDFADKASKKAKDLAANLDKVGTSADKNAAKTKNATSSGGGAGGSSGASDKIKKKLETYQKQVIGIYGDINSAIVDAQEKADEALINRNEKMLDAHKSYDEKVADLNKTYNEAYAEADKRYSEAVADAQKRRDKAETQAYKQHKEALENIEKDYTKKTIELQKNLDDKLADIKKKAAIKSEELTKSATEKQASIIVQSMDRLRNAFASQTGFNIGEAFKGGADSADKLLADLKTKLEAAKNLQANAAVLAGMGYSQVFIEEVVKQGPEAGNKIAEALKAASPDATKELQSLYGQVQTVSAHGLDALAQTMNAGGQLATEELMNAYTQVSVDLKESLAAVNSEMELALADAQNAYEEAMVEAKAARDEKIADADKALKEALADAKAAYDEALADAQKALEEARAAADKDLKEGLADATKTLQDALLKTQNDYEKALDDINKSTDKKLKDLKQKLAEIAAEMAMLGTAEASKAAVLAIQNAPGYTPIVAQQMPGGNDNTSLSNGTQLNLTQNFTNAVVDPAQVQDATVSGIKYGNAVIIANPALRGVANKLNAMGID